MATALVQDYIKDSVGNPARGAQVTVDLIATDSGEPGVGFVVADKVTILESVTLNADKDGFWQASLAINQDITPGNTYYRVSYRRFRARRAEPAFLIIVPAGGPWWVGDIMAVSPPPLAPNYVGQSLDYSEITTNNGTSSTNPVSFSPPLVINPTIGDRPIDLELYVPLTNSTNAFALINIAIYDTTGGINTQVARFATNAQQSVIGLARRRLLPSSGARTYEGKFYVSANSGNANACSPTPISLEAIQR